uniref:Pilus assembly protein PilO n=1 Tax=Thermocrinis ruber TaxID=75906 RepID=A0A7C5SXE0_9AQUI
MEKLKAQWAALPQWQKLFILLILPIVIIGYIYAMLITSLREDLEKSRKEKEELTRRIAELKRLTEPKALEPLRKQRDDLKAQLEVKKQELELVVGEMPSTKDVSSIYKELGAIASKSGVRILSISLAKPNEVGYTLEKTPEGRAVVKIVKEQPQQQGQQQQQKPQEQKSQQKAQEQKQQTSNVVKHPTAELKISFVGGYTNVVNFLKSLENGGFVSYPSAFKVERVEKGMLKGDLTILVIMKEEKI